MIPALDDAAALEAADPAGMLRHVAAGAAHVRASARMALEAGLDEALRGAGRPRAVVVADGGSGVAAGELLAAVCGPGCPVPVVTHSGGSLPGWVGAADLLFAVSDDALPVAEQAVRRGTAVVGVGPAQSRLAQLAVQSRSLHLPVPPAGAARTLLWGQVVPMALVAGGLGLLTLPEDELERTAERLEEVSNRCRPSSEPFVNPAKQAALELAGALPMAWGGSPLGAAAARRFADQLAANASQPCAVPAAGALDAASREGGGDPDDFFRDRGDDEEGPRLHLVYFADGEERPEIGEVARARGVPVTVIRSEGAHPLERAASLIAMCDYVSVYLALALGVDPTPVPALQELRARTA